MPLTHHAMIPAAHNRQPGVPAGQRGGAAPSLWKGEKTARRPTAAVTRLDVQSSPTPHAKMRCHLLLRLCENPDFAILPRAFFQATSSAVLDGDLVAACWLPANTVMFGWRYRTKFSHSLGTSRPSVVAAANFRFLPSGRKRRSVDEAFSKLTGGLRENYWLCTCDCGCPGPVSRLGSRNAARSSPGPLIAPTVSTRFTRTWIIRRDTVPVLSFRRPEAPVDGHGQQG